MPEPYTIDASVFLNAWDTREAGRQASYDFLRRAGIVHAALFLPTLVLPEVAASATRNGNPSRGTSLVEAIKRSVNVRFIELDREFADLAVTVATRSRLRGSDAVYAAVALRYSTVLVTRDGEMRQRLVGIVTAQTPEEALALL